MTVDWSLVTFGLFTIALVLVGFLVVDVALSIEGHRDRQEARRRNHGRG